MIFTCLDAKRKRTALLFYSSIYCEISSETVRFVLFFYSSLFNKDLRKKEKRANLGHSVAYFVLFLQITCLTLVSMRKISKKKAPWLSASILYSFKYCSIISSSVSSCPFSSKKTGSLSVLISERSISFSSESSSSASFLDSDSFFSFLAPKSSV